jgi:hypothetical protein
MDLEPSTKEKACCEGCKTWTDAYRKKCNGCLAIIIEKKIALERDLRINRAANKYEIRADGSINYIIDPRISELTHLKS